jgi:hypothetical protein
VAVSFAINSGCHALWTPGPDSYSDTCVSVEDHDGDGRSDDITMRFTGEDGHQYELRVRANPRTHRWGPRSEVTLTDLGKLKVLAHYSVADNYTLVPLDVGTNECIAAPTPERRRDVPNASIIPEPSGQRTYVVIGNDSRVLDHRFGETLEPWINMGIESRSGRPMLQVSSEGVVDQNVFAIERGPGHVRREARFVRQGDYHLNQPTTVHPNRL